MLLLATEIGFCTSTANIWHLLSFVVLIIKIVIPLALIILGMVDLGKAVISSDDKAIGKAVGALVRRFIAAVVVFFIPTIISAIFNIIGVFGDQQADYSVCVECITKGCEAKANAVTSGF